MKLQANQLHQALENGKRVILIDVRTPVEHDEMHIPGSKLMPLDRLDPAAVKSASGNAEQNKRSKNSKPPAATVSPSSTAASSLGRPPDSRSSAARATGCR
jgi:rhodanese-related sulfurtransferase